MKSIKPMEKFSVQCRVDGDKSITHRAIMLSAIADKPCKIYNPLISLDTLATADCMRKLGAEINQHDNYFEIKPIKQMNDGAVLDAKNSGTTIRLLTGLVCVFNVNCRLTGDESLQKRPMMRVKKPLEQLGAKLELTNNSCPIYVEKSVVLGGELKLEVPSAQVKSAILLAGLGSKNGVTLHFDVETRNHTELMLKAMGADIEISNNKIVVKNSKLSASDMTVCGDISSAAFIIALAARLGRAYIEGVGMNPSRTGIFKVLDMFGVSYELKNERLEGLEPVCDISVKKSEFKPISLGGGIIANIIDELPIIAVMMAFAKGRSVVKNAEELKVKESNRIELICDNLKGMGVDIEPTDDGFIVNGNGHIEGDENFIVKSKYDHRISMSMIIAALTSERGAIIDDTECIDVSFPSFLRIIESSAQEN